MTTPGLRVRVAVVSLAVLALAFAGFAVAVTITYRDGLISSLRSRLEADGAALRAAPPGQIKALVPTLALDGVEVQLTSQGSVPSKPGGPLTALPNKPAGVQTEGSRLVLTETLPPGAGPTEATLIGSIATVAGSVERLIAVEAIAATVTLVLAALLLLRGIGAALAPLARVGQIAGRIAAGDRRLRLRPANAGSELGAMAAAFDAMVDALESALEQAQASEDAMRRFIADASHELRTPVAALQATSETLLREQPERPARDRLEARLARDAARLGRLADDLLNLARLEAGEAPRREPVELAAIADAAASEARIRAGEAEITVACGDDTTVLGDADALSRALWNLLENALAATRHAGRIGIEVGSRGGDVVAAVRDDGPGVPPAERERIFDGFVRLSGAAPPGAGLGLAIARRIARRHGGELRCEECESGACFTLSLPAAPAKLELAT